jgi:hypothetical protein
VGVLRNFCSCLCSQAFHGKTKANPYLRLTSTALGNLERQKYILPPVCNCTRKRHLTMSPTGITFCLSCRSLLFCRLLPPHTNTTRAVSRPGNVARGLHALLQVIHLIPFFVFPFPHAQLIVPFICSSW